MHWKGKERGDFKKLVSKDYKHNINNEIVWKLAFN